MILHVALLSVFLLAVIGRDMRTFEIDFAALAVVALNGACLNLYLDIPVEDMVVGGGCWAMAWGIIRWVLGRHAIGQGDLWLFATVGLLAGLSGSLFAAGVLCGLTLITAYGYRASRERARSQNASAQRRVVRRFEIHPAAVPAGITLFVVFMARIADVSRVFDQPTLWPAWGQAINATLYTAVVDWGMPVAVATAIAALVCMVFDCRDAAPGGFEQAQGKDGPPC